MRARVVRDGLTLRECRYSLDPGPIPWAQAQASTVEYCYEDYVYARPGPIYTVTVLVGPGPGLVLMSCS